ncbi:hypothetical protein ACLOJK_013335 [Asimina triloba]
MFIPTIENGREEIVSADLKWGKILHERPNCIRKRTTRSPPSHQSLILAFSLLSHRPPLPDLTDFTLLLIPLLFPIQLVPASLFLVANGGKISPFPPFSRHLSSLSASLSPIGSLSSSLPGCRCRTIALYPSSSLPFASSISLALLHHRFEQLLFSGTFLISSCPLRRRLCLRRTTHGLQMLEDDILEDHGTVEIRNRNRIFGWLEKVRGLMMTMVMVTQDGLEMTTLEIDDDDYRGQLTLHWGFQR